MAAFAAPIVTIASNNSSNNMEDTPVDNSSEAFIGNSISNVEILGSNEKYPQDALDEMFYEKYNNEYYRDIFYNTVANTNSSVLSTKTIPLKNIDNQLDLIEKEYCSPAIFFDELSLFSNISVKYTSEGLPAFIIEGNDTNSSLVLKSDNELPQDLLSIIQGAYSCNSSFLIKSDLSDEDKAYATALAINLFKNNISLDTLKTKSTPVSENEDRWHKILDFIELLLNNSYKNGYVNIDFSDKIIEKEYTVATESNFIETNYDIVYLDIYDDKGYLDVNIARPQKLDVVENQIFSNNDSFSCEIDKNSLLNRKNLLYSLGEDESIFPSNRFNPKLNDLKVICSGNDITLKTYKCENSVYYIPETESSVFIYDLDMHPEQFSNLYKYYNLNITLKDDSENLIPSINLMLLKKNLQTNEYETAIENVSSNNNGEISFNKLSSGQYKIVVCGDNNYYKDDTEITIGTDNSILDTFKNYDMVLDVSRINNTEFQIPFNRQQMADYLNLDRSALSKELGKMQDEGIITFNKNRFKLNINYDSEF